LPLTKPLKIQRWLHNFICSLLQIILGDSSLRLPSQVGRISGYLDAYIAAAGIADDRKGLLFRAAIGRTGKISDRPMSRVDPWYMVQRRTADAGIEAAIGNHSFLAIGIIAQRMAGHANIKTTWVYAGATMR
jgi:hypothetical protein